MTDPRKTYAYQKAAAALRAKRLPCSLCGHAIDYSVTGPAARSHPLAFVADHIVPVSKGGAGADPANLAAAHRRCNGSKGNRAGIKRPGGSRRW